MTKREQIDKARKRIADLEELFSVADAEQMSNDVRSVMSTAEGRRLFVRLVSVAGVYAPPSPMADPNVRAYNDGVRSVGLHVLDVVGRIAYDEKMLAVTECDRRKAERDERLRELKGELEEALRG